MAARSRDNRHKGPEEDRNQAGEANNLERDRNLEEALDSGNPGEVGHNLGVGRNDLGGAHNSEEDGHNLEESGNLHPVKGLNLLIFDMNTR